MEKDKSNLEFLYSGDIWSALWGDNFAKHLAKAISYTVHKGKPFFVTTDFSFIEYTYKNSLIKFNGIIKHENDKNFIISLFPYCIGAENEVVLSDMSGCEEDNIEGYIKLQKNNAAPMWMFNPLYRQQSEMLSKNIGKKQTFQIAGIGWNIEKTETPYTHALIVSKFCDDAYEFSSDIFSITEFKFHGVKFYCFEIEVLQFSDEQTKDETGLKIKLYVNKQLLGKYKPQVGDNIRGLMQLTSYAI